jgi:hypothetical protein
VDEGERSKGEAADETLGPGIERDSREACESRDPEDDAEQRRLARDEQNGPDQDHDDDRDREAEAIGALAPALDRGTLSIDRGLSHRCQSGFGQVGPLGLDVERSEAASVEPLDVFAPTLCDREAEVDAVEDPRLGQRATLHKAVEDGQRDLALSARLPKPVVEDGCAIC